MNNVDPDVISELAHDIFVADNWRSKDPEKLWLTTESGHRRYAFSIAHSLILGGWAKDLVGGAA